MTKERVVLAYEDDATSLGSPEVVYADMAIECDAIQTSYHTTEMEPLALLIDGVVTCYIPAGVSPIIPVKIPKGSEVALEYTAATPSDGRIAINFIST